MGLRGIKKCACLPQLWGTYHYYLPSGGQTPPGYAPGNYGILNWAAVQVPAIQKPFYQFETGILDINYPCQPFSSRANGYIISGNGPHIVNSASQGDNQSIFTFVNMGLSRCIYESGVTKYVVYIMTTPPGSSEDVPIGTDGDGNPIANPNGPSTFGTLTAQCVLDVQSGGFLPQYWLGISGSTLSDIGATSVPWWHDPFAVPEGLDIPTWTDVMGDPIINYTSFGGFFNTWSYNLISLHRDWLICSNHAGAYYGTHFDDPSSHQWPSYDWHVPEEIRDAELGGSTPGYQPYWCVQRFNRILSDPASDETYPTYYEGISGPQSVFFSDRNDVENIHIDYHICLGAVHQAPYVIGYNSTTGSALKVVVGQWLNDDNKQTNNAIADWEYTNVAHLRADEVTNVLGVVPSGEFGVIYYDRKDNIDMAIVRVDGTHYMYTGISGVTAPGFIALTDQPTCMAIDDDYRIIYGSNTFITKLVSGTITAEWTHTFTHINYQNNIDAGILMGGSPFGAYIDYNDKWYLINGIDAGSSDFSNFSDYIVSGDWWADNSANPWENISQRIHAGILSHDGSICFAPLQWWTSLTGEIPGIGGINSSPNYENRMPLDIGGHKYVEGTTPQFFLADWLCYERSSSSQYSNHYIQANYELVKDR